MTRLISGPTPSGAFEFVDSFCTVLLGTALDPDELLAEHLDSLSMLELAAAVEDFASLPTGSLSRGAWDSYTTRVLAHVAGLFTDYNADVQSQRAHVSELVADFPDSATVIAAFRAYIDLLFRSWPFRSIYLEIPSFNMAVISPTHLPVRLEAVLSEYEFYDGEWWDLAIYVVERAACFRYNTEQE